MKMDLSDRLFFVNHDYYVIDHKLELRAPSKSEVDSERKGPQLVVSVSKQVP